MVSWNGQARHITKRSPHKLVRAASRALTIVDGLYYNVMAFLDCSRSFRQKSSVTWYVYEPAMKKLGTGVL